MDIYKKLDNVIEELRDDSTIHELKDEVLKIPTLEKEYYRELSPQLEARFSKLGYWEDATHGDWLDVEKMKLFWDENSENPIVINVFASIKNWANDVASLFKSNRVSVFAGSQYTSERVYLIWLDFKKEPEVWVYDTNGLSRYKDLLEYLTAYLEDDLSKISDIW